MPDVNVSLQDTNLSVNLNQPAVHISIADENIEVNLGEPEVVNIQIQEPNITVNFGCGCNNGNAPGGATAWGDITGTLADQTDLQTALDGKSDVGHTHPLSDIEQSGATDGQVPVWDDGAGEWIPGNAPGGAASIIEKTYAEMQTLIAADGLTPGQQYNITDAAGSDLGVVLMALTVNELAVQGSGGFLNADFQAVGVYSGVIGETGIAAGTQKGIWRTGFEVLTIAYTNLTGGTFAVGDTITGGSTGAMAVIVTDDGASSMTAYITSAGVAFDDSEVLDNGAGVTADMDGAASAPDISEGDIVIWDLKHFQLTDDSQLSGTDPATNTAAYTELARTVDEVGYVTAWDVVEFDFEGNELGYRSDLLGNKIVGAPYILAFQWGKLGTFSNSSILAGLDVRNIIGQTNWNILYQGGQVLLVGNCDSTSNIAYQSAQASGLSLGAGSVFNNNQMQQSSGFLNSVFGAAMYIDSNIFYNAAACSGFTFGDNCSFSFNQFFPASSVHDIMAGAGVFFDGNIFLSYVEVSNKSIADGISFATNTIGVPMTETETISENIIGKRAIPGFSDIPCTIDITGLTTLDITAAKAQYCGIINITSGNATEAIDTISNFPTAFPFVLRPAAGLTLTVTGTSISGIGAGQIALTTTDVVLDGTKGEWLELEADPGGGGFLREKNRSGTLL